MADNREEAVSISIPFQSDSSSVTPSQNPASQDWHQSSFANDASSSQPPSYLPAPNSPVNSAAPHSLSASVCGEPTGKAAKFLSGYGMGWLLDTTTTNPTNNGQSYDDDEDAELFGRPLLEELDIDLADIWLKLQLVLMPPLPGHAKTAQRTCLRDNPDFWGPLMVVLAFSLVSIYGQFRVLSWILTCWVFGSFLVFFLARVLGADSLTCSQCLGVTGYALLPMTLIALPLPAFSSLAFVSFLLKAVSVVWSTISCASLLCTIDNFSSGKAGMLAYPIFLLYVYMISLHTGA